MKQIHKVLSIQVNLNGLSFCIVNRDKKVVEHLHEVSFEKTLTPHEVLPVIKTELSSKTVFSDDFSEVVIIHQNELASLVPNDLFDENKSADYLKFNSKILKSDYISHDDLDVIEAKSVYVPYVNINNYIFDTFGQFVYKHSLTVFSEAILKTYGDKGSSTKVYINVNLSSFEIVVVKEGSIVLTNIHQYFSKEDFIYFVLFTLEQLHLDPNEIEIVLSGNIDENDELYSVLFTYIRNIDFNTLPKNIKWSDSNSKESSRHYLIINSLY